MDTIAYLSLDALAVKIGLPRTYLRTLADQGRIPCLHVGGRLRFDLQAVRAALIELSRATQASGEAVARG